MRVLAIDTSNQVMSIALNEDKKLIAELTTNVKRNHSERLMPAIEKLMKEVNWSPDSLNRIAISKGPGSYTGLRIGLTVAKTLAWTLDIDLVAVSSLKVLAANIYAEGQLIVPLFDARRGNIYTGLYKMENGSYVPLEEDTHISSKKWAFYLSKYKRPMIIVGQDIKKHEVYFKEELADKVKMAEDEWNLPRASRLATLAYEEKPVNVHTFIPEYLKLTEAEETWKAAHPNEVGGLYVEKI
ncbi:tRNA (adenosine(37)-N6)-threonylcarbamoyltransferase complex dimerization subunit type 1 TsaB [Lacticigenium naphthae]|uniref:tRNA (adenosine(37)-N6)-threonylcarbamoyltransferase complex dimerization subunit type 1 TsaB n=1 Tax=Lacticigenium naphthae TaxID=515351 RepID=UPI00041D411E|nr:tRNA (adenosine(37)-N6)-threonylcarbamoyltransferase complex dimerization subunit type 1 TsaB [Lacticigenium naphthae]